PVAVTIHDLRVTRVAPPEVDFEVECSSGTYIRAIARDAGEALGVGAHLTALRRTRIGEHSVDGAVPLDRLDDADAVRDALLTPAQAVSHLPSVVVDEDGEAAIAHGRAVSAAESLATEGPLAILSSDGRLLALGERRGDRVQPRRVFA
ncbi:MAG TPA: tRNA pseudouridine(55) synthase TruB, partial [Longimicrobiaceae bacterium]|nr:tRNA pseudouridine(55) synthase TruB [Longimicrobiaceae bacterium]